MKRQHNHKKELTEIQLLKQENSNLRSENRNLKKKLKRLERREHTVEIINYNDPEEVVMTESIDKKERCPECNKGEVVHYNVVGRTWSECSQCSYRTKTVKI